MRPVLVLGTALLIATSAGAQQRPDLSGNWRLNPEKSEIPPAMGQGGRAGGPPDGAGAGRGIGMGMGVPISVYITQTGEKLLLDQKVGDQARMLTYYLDGRESRNRGMRDSEVVSKARWDGAALVIESTMSLETPMGPMTLATKEIRTLSEDGNTLTAVVTTTTPRGEITRTLVYEKQ